MWAASKKTAGKGEVILVIGGIRSGKSDFAVKLAQASRRKVIFIATAEPKDQDMRERIQAHRENRPQVWKTMEEPIALAEKLGELSAKEDFVLVDCLTLWVSNLIVRETDEDFTDALLATAKRHVQQECVRLINA